MNSKNIATMLVLLLLCACGTQPEQSFVASINSREAAKLPAHCTAGDTIVLDRPENIRNTTSPKFKYRAKYVKPTDKNFPTVVYLTGGPGQTSMELDFSNEFPFGWGVVQIDLRGIGCNEHLGGLHPELFYTSEAMASDVVAVISTLGLKNYIVYGISYGTLLGTIVAHQLDQSKLPGPIAVVHQGTLGRAFKVTENPNAAVVRLWDETFAKLPAAAQEELQREKPLGVSSESWKAFFNDRISAGEIILGTGKQVNPILLALQNMTSDLQNPYNVFLARNVSESVMAEGEFSNAQQRLYKYIACSEITSNAGEGLKFKNGKFIYNTQNNLCKDTKLNRPFDSAQHSARFKTFYIQGSQDPATEAWQTEYHFEKNIKSHKTFVLVKGAGHNPMSSLLSGCRQQIWTSIGGDSIQIEDALKACSQTQVAVKYASPKR